MFVTDDIRYIGVDDHRTDLFEGQYPVPNGISYNSYAVMDSKIAVMDTVDGKFTHEWLDNLQRVIGERRPDYLVVHHMEPDHSASLASFMSA
ncbi:MAG: FprA family A-type flavoprotein, partial [Sphaerochaetaceae bacterium]